MIFPHFPPILQAITREQQTCLVYHNFYRTLGERGGPELALRKSLLTSDLACNFHMLKMALVTCHASVIEPKSSWGLMAVTIKIPYLPAGEFETEIYWSLSKLN